MGEERSALPGQWREKLPELLARDERFAREFARQQGDLLALRQRCGETARLLVLGNYLKEALTAARDSLDEGKLANAISGMVDRFSGYRINEVVVPAGRNVLGEKYYEFYVDEQLLDALILRLFYAPKG